MFTDREIDLARLLKEQSSYVWTPKIGDWYWHETPDVITGEMEMEVYKAYVWLPLLHQCIEIIQSRGMELYFDTKDKEVEVYYPSKRMDRDRFVCSGDGETILEAFYDALTRI